ncbi:MAG TPA: polysaccharide deacetylase family protein [Xanthobacteraceae bacterium]
MTVAKLTISIDLELAWGVWDHLTPTGLRLVETAERPICTALIELFDRHRVPATWAIVAALLDEASAASRPGPKACWFAPDIIDHLRSNKAGHEIGSHSGRHIYFDNASADDARADLEFAKSVHHAHELGFKSFVFPRGASGHLDAVADVGLKVFNAADVGWVESARRLGRHAGQIANLLDKLLPVPPRSARPEPCGELIHIAKSMLLMARNGPRRFVLPAVTRAKLRAGLRRAQETAGIFHVWFHPSNFYFRRDEQLATLDWFLEHAAKEAAQGRVDFRTMGSYALEPASPVPDHAP